MSKRHSRTKDIMQFDSNRDGVLSYEEFAAGRQPRFDRYDVDGDGIVTAAEIDAVMMKRVVKRRDRMLKMRDADGDGKISKAEFDFATRQKFTRLDRNGNGLLEPVSGRGGKHRHHRHHHRGHHKRY